MGIFTACPNSHVPVVAPTTPTTFEVGTAGLLQSFGGSSGLKQRRRGLFWSLPAFQKPGSLKRQLHPCRSCGAGLPFQAKAAQRGSRRSCRYRCVRATAAPHRAAVRSEEHTSELQSLMRISYAVFCLKKKTQ